MKRSKKLAPELAEVGSPQTIIHPTRPALSDAEEVFLSICTTSNVDCGIADARRGRYKGKGMPEHSMSSQYNRIADGM